MEKETEQKINRLSQLEQSAHQFLSQRQEIQTQVLETESALKELENTEKSYKIIGNIMVATDKGTLVKDLNSKKEMLELRIKAIQKQEDKLKEQASKLQKEVMEKLDKSDKDGKDR
jgi:prefoldin beta subunit